MIISNSKPEIPVAAPRGAHFYRIHDLSLREIEGEPADVLDLNIMLQWLIQHKDNPELLDAVHDINANAGISVNLKNLHAGQAALADIFIDNREDSTGPVLLPLDAIAQLILHHEKHKNIEKRDIIINFITSLGLEPNLPKLRADYCPTCGK